jgi:gamma-glutamylcyclotransferase
VSLAGERVVYFAYGANVHPAWLRRRIPDAILVGPGVLPGYRLAFRKRGRDGAARSDACPSDAPGAGLPGALYSMRAPDLQRLGAAGAGYLARQVRVESPTGPVDAIAWVAAPGEIDTRLLPWDWYVALIRAGAEQLRLPAEHRRWLANIRTVVDPDAERAAPAREIVAGVPPGSD